MKITVNIKRQDENLLILITYSFPRKTWSECVKNDLSAHNLINVKPLDGESLRQKIKDSLVLPTPDAGTTATP